MKDNLQNIADLIGALAEDIEEIKKKTGREGQPGQGRGIEKAGSRSWSLSYGSLVAMRRKTSMPFSGAKEAIEEYKKSLGDEMVVSSTIIYRSQRQGYAQSAESPPPRICSTRYLELLTSHMENDRQASQKTQPRARLSYRGCGRQSARIKR